MSEFYPFLNGKVYSFKYTNSLDHQNRLVIVTENNARNVKGDDLSVTDDAGSTFRNFSRDFIEDIKEVPHDKIDSNLLPSNVDLSLLIEGYEEDGKIAHLVDHILYIVDNDDIPKQKPDFYADVDGVDDAYVSFVLNGKHLELFNDGSIYYTEENRSMKLSEFVAEVNKIKI